MKLNLNHRVHKGHRVFFLCVLCALCVKICLAQTQEFTHTARVVMGSRETQDECREFAKVEARRAVLEQVGVYIETRSDLMQHIRESATGITDETDMQKRVLAIAAGVTQLEVAGQEWKSEGGALVLYLTCRITVNPDEVAQRLTELVKDRQKTEDYIHLQGEVERLRGQFEELRQHLELSSADMISQLQESRKEISAGLSAVDWLEKAYSAPNLDKVIEYSSKVIRDNPKYVEAYIVRGSASFDKSDYKLAINDFNQAIRLDPKNAKAYSMRGNVYYMRRNLELAIEDYSQAVELKPTYIGAWTNLGYAYELKHDISNARWALQRAADLGGEDAKRVLEELR